MNPIDAFRDTLAAAGLRTEDQFIDDGKIHRFTVHGDKPKSLNGWYVLHTDGVPAGAFGSWKHDVSGTWCAKTETEFTAADRAEYRQRMDTMRKEREAEQQRVRQEARERAALIWDSLPPANDNHPYLVRKQVKAFGIRESRGSLVIPVISADRVLQSLQFIDADGNKLFLRGGMKAGCYFRIGDAAPTDRVIVAEGYATAASLHMAHGCPVAIAFDAGNLQAVSEAIRGKLPDSIAIEIWADNDLKTKGNPGLTKATRAAEAIGAKVVVPEIDGDWNDVAVADGIDAVRDVVVANDNHAVIKPIDIFAEFPVPPIAYDMLPKAIADYAFDSGELIGVEPSMIAIPALVACAAAMHDGVRIQPKRHETGWTESARLWCALVGSPSIKKSPAIKRATRRLRKIDMELHDDNEKLAARHSAEMEQFKEAKKEAKKTGEVVRAPDQPKMNRMVVEDITVEALSEVLKDNSRGVLCVQDELSGWFGSMDAYSGSKSGGKDRAHWLEAYNGGGRVVDRVMRGSLKIPNWSVSMIGGIQPEVIRRIAQNMTDDGLMQRFMIIVGSNVPEQDRPENNPATNAYSDLVDHLYGVAPSNNAVTLTEDAHQVREALTAYATEMAAYPSLPGGLKTHLSKWSGLFARLLLLYHAIECANLEHPVSRQVSGDTARRVDRLMRKYLLPHSMAYYTDILGAATELEHARWIAGDILSKNLKVITLRDIQQHYKQWRSLDDWKRTKVMQTLEDMGWLIVMEDDRKSRRGAHTWAVNTAVHAKFKDRAAKEAASRAKIREELISMKVS